MQILVLGGSGFIGHAVVGKLKKFGHDICVSSRKAAIDQADIEHVSWDRYGKQSLEISLIRDWDVIIDLSCFDAVAAQQTCELASTRTHVIFASSSLVYQGVEDDELSEASRLNPTSSFAIDKLAAEKHFWSESSGMRALTILRPSYVMGENSMLSDGLCWPTDFYRRMELGLPVIVSASALNKISILSDEYVAMAIQDILDTREGVRILNLCQMTVSWYELYNQFISKAGLKKVSCIILEKDRLDAFEDICLLKQYFDRDHRLSTCRMEEILSLPVLDHKYIDVMNFSISVQRCKLKASPHENMYKDLRGKYNTIVVDKFSSNINQHKQ